METVECGIVVLRPELSLLKILVQGSYRSGDRRAILGSNNLAEPMLLHKISSRPLPC
jgi:hypothetical protein